MSQIMVLATISPDTTVTLTLSTWDAAESVPEDERDDYSPQAQAANFGHALVALQTAVGGPIEVFHMFSEDDSLKRLTAYCHEEGKLEGQPVNALATDLWRDWLGFRPDDVLVGSVVLEAGPFDAGFDPAKWWWDVLWSAAARRLKGDNNT